MDARGHFQTQTANTSTQPLVALQQALRSRQLLTYREGDTLVVNDPYLRQRVDVTCNERWFCWWSPAGERKFVDRHRPADTVDQIVEQYAGVYMEDRGTERVRQPPSQHPGPVVDPHPRVLGHARGRAIREKRHEA